ncbi:hypothetical protein PG999_005275 [Apiospora kogelbergensis]|uniref:Uncharacterized protein n=1 Tax=Apiospora kogelbergensis TaxID=1337665 RepID=A0AAW0R1P0_9PEZI
MHVISATIHHSVNYVTRTRRADSDFYSHGTRRDQLKRTFPTRVARKSASIGFAMAENLVLVLIGALYILCTLSLDSLDTLLVLGVRWSRCLARPFFVGLSLVLGFRLCTTVAMQQPVVWAVVAYIAYAYWFICIAWSYVEHPERWDLSSWPRRPRTIGRAMKSWYNSPVFWNLAGAGLILKSHVDGITEPLFPYLTPESVW